MPGTVDQMIERLRAQSGAAIPSADLLIDAAYDELIEDAIESKHIGRGVIDGVECEHLAYRTPEVDWQIWIEMGARPLPRKYVITSKTLTGSPQYTVRFRNWRTDPPVGADAFAFSPPEGARKVAADTMAQVDEVPAGVAMAGR
jgi:hypothetical protein